MPTDGEPFTRGDDAGLVVHVADLHLNSQRGLCPPVIDLDDGGQYRASRGQQETWQNWLQFWCIIWDMKRQYGMPLYTVIDGDLMDINRHDRLDPITPNAAIVGRTGLQVVGPVAEMSDYTFIIRGTEAHTGEHCELEEALAYYLVKDGLAVPDEVNGTASWAWLPLEVGGVTFDVTHHPHTFGRRPWTVDAAPGREGAIIRDEYYERGERPPDVAIRAHVHKWLPGNRRLAPQVFYLPPWKLADAYSHRLGAGGAVEPVGGAWFLCTCGRYRWDVERWRPKRRPTWTTKSTTPD